MRHRDRARGRRHRQHAVAVDRLERALDLCRRRGQHPRQEEHRVPVGDDDARITRECREQAFARAGRGFHVGVISHAGLRQRALVLGHALQHERVQASVRVGIAAAQRFENDERPGQRRRVRHRMLQREVRFEASGRGHPVEDDARVRAEGTTVELIKAIGTQRFIIAFVTRQPNQLEHGSAMASRLLRRPDRGGRR
jgi:hypothetical protein